MSDLVSVIIPTYNRAKYIGEAIESVLAQTYSPIEIIVVDDGSTDNTCEIVAKYEPRVRYVYQNNAWCGAARNNGIRLATGKYTAFLDSDDLWLPEKLERDVEFLENHPKIGVVYSNCEFINAEGQVIKQQRRQSLNGWITSELLQSNPIITCTLTVRSEILRVVGGFREEREISEDWELWVRLSTRTQFAHLDCITAQKRDHPANIISDAKAIERSSALVTKVFAEADYLTAEQKKLLPKTQANIALINAINYCSAGDVNLSFKYLKQAFKFNKAIVVNPAFVYTILRFIGGSQVSKLMFQIRRVLRKIA
jgi:glycosyltransferase involved in cell wall biosynthesis